MGLQDAIDTGFRHKVVVGIGNLPGQLPGRQVGPMQRASFLVQAHTLPSQTFFEPVIAQIELRYCLLQIAVLTLEAGEFISVYRILKAHDLITSPQFTVMSAADKFQHPTSRVHELWQTDFTYFRVVDWGWYFLSTILDD